MTTCYQYLSHETATTSRRIFRGALALLFSLLMLSVQSASAQYAGGFVWADQPTADSYTPEGFYSYNSTTDSPESGITISRSAVGVYNVVFGGLESIGVNGGHVQVSGYLNNPSYCGIGGWSANSVSVFCFDAAGAAVDAYYTVHYLKPEAETPGLAFAWANDMSSASYTPSTGYSYNAGGGAITATRSGVGTYSVLFDGYESVGVNGGHVQVTSYGGTNASCKVVSWGSNTVNVACYDTAGDLVDSQFTVMYAKPEGGTGNLAYAWANDPTSASYEPSTGYSYNAAGAGIVIDRNDVGAYTLTFTDYGAVGFNGGNVLVTAYNGGSERCKIGSWGGGSVNVNCFDISGAPIDALYTVLYWRPEEPVIPAAGEELNGVSFAWGNDPLSDSYTPSIPYLINESGLNATISRSATGAYSVNFDGLTGGGVNGGTVQLSAYGAASSDCQVNFWSDSAVNLGCYDQAGAPADTRYSVLYVSPTEETTGLAYAWANDMTSASYAPDASYAYNAAGGAITITRSSAGVYDVDFADYGAVGINGGHVQVSSYGSSGERCNTSGWGSSNVGVVCFDVSGNPVDSRYSVLFLKPEVDTPGMAYAWANDATGASYTPSTSYSYNAGGGEITATRSGTGTYNMAFAGYEAVGANGGNVQVSAYGSTGARCSVANWGPNNVNVTCVDAAGAPVDVAYDVLYLKPTVNTGTAIENDVELTDELDDITNFPNPFRGTTTITYELVSSTAVVLTVHDLTGRLVTTLVDAVQPAGEQAVQFDASGLSSGVYFYSLRTSNGLRRGKMTLGR